MSALSALSALSVGLGAGGDMLLTGIDEVEYAPSRRQAGPERGQTRIAPSYNSGR